MQPGKNNKEGDRESKEQSSKRQSALSWVANITGSMILYCE